MMLLPCLAISAMIDVYKRQAFQYADADYCDKSDSAYDDERINVFQRNFGEVLIEILKGVQLAAVGTVRFLFSPFRGSLWGLVFDFVCHSGLLLGQVLAQVKGRLLYTSRCV